MVIALVTWVVVSIKSYRSGNARDCLIMALLYLAFLAFVGLPLLFFVFIATNDAEATDVSVMRVFSPLIAWLVRCTGE